MGITKIKLYGNLAKKYGKEFSFQGVNTVLEAIDALAANFNGFREAVLKNKKYQVYIDENNIDSKELELPVEDKTIKIIPVLMGASGGVAKVILGVVLIAVAVFLPSQFSPLLLKLGIGMILAGFAELLFQPPEQNPDDASDTSYLFSGAINISQEGLPVPIGYGRVIIGSTNISNSISGYNPAVGAGLGEGSGC